MMSKAEWFVVRKPEIIAKSVNQFCGGKFGWLKEVWVYETIYIHAYWTFDPG